MVACLARGPKRSTTRGRRKRSGVSWCGLEDCKGPSRCRACANAYMRDWRARGREKPPGLAESRARAVVSMALHRGTIKRGSCERCGAAKVEAHHDDYTKPRQVRWLCRACHKHIHF